MSDARFATSNRRLPLRTGVVIAAVAWFSACADDTVDPGKACVAPESPVPASVVEGLSLSDLRAAVRDAAERNAAALPANNATTELRGTLSVLADHLGSAQRETTCQAITKATVALAKQPDDAATLPDRTAVKLVLDMVSTVLSSK